MIWLAAVSLIAGHCAAEADPCVFVNGWETKPSSRNVELLLLLNDKPQANARLTIITINGKGWRYVVTDPDGTAMLKGLSPGITCVAAMGGRNDLFAELCLDISAQSDSSRVSQFRMSLTRNLPRISPLHVKVKQLEESPPSLRVRSLKGTVMDPVGAVIRGAEVQIYGRGAYPEGPMETLRTNEIGEFSDMLAPGIYTVVVRAPGFAPDCFAVEVRRESNECELFQMLEIEAMANDNTMGRQF